MIQVMMCSKNRNSDLAQKAPGLWAKQLMGLCGERWNGVLLLHRKQCLIMNIMMINE
jgi:hypothetical protein